MSQVSPQVQSPSVEPLNYHLCAYHAGGIDFAKVMFYCEPRVIWGQYVIIQRLVEGGLLGDDRSLQLCEVEVYEDPGKP